MVRTVVYGRAEEKTWLFKVTTTGKNEQKLRGWQRRRRISSNMIIYSIEKFTAVVSRTNIVASRI